MHEGADVDFSSPICGQFGGIIMPKWLDSTTKMLVWWFAVNSTIWIYTSYILAYIGAAEIAESLSRVVVTEIIAVILGYMLKAVIENVSKGKSEKSKNNAKRDC